MKKLTLIFATNFTFLLLSFTTVNASSCTSGCQTDDCHVVIEQTTEMWRMNINCGDGGTVWEGDGQYSGTICGGFTPCQL